MIKHKYIIDFDCGMSARSSMIVVREALAHVKNLNYFKIKKDDKEIDGFSIMSLLGLAAIYGSEITFIIDGEDEQIVLDNILKGLENFKKELRNET